jgi:hypothetical protein
MPHLFTKQSRDSRPSWLSLSTRNAPSYMKRIRYTNSRHIYLVSIYADGILTIYSIVFTFFKVCVRYLSTLRYLSVAGHGAVDFVIPLDSVGVW